MSLRLLSIKLYLAFDRLWRSLHRLFLFWKSGRGAEAFLERYRADHVLATTEAERVISTQFEKCQVCSLCTFSCDAIKGGRAPALFEPKQMVAFFGRHSMDGEVFLEDWYPCAECGACTVLCPNDVPVHGIVRQILERRNRLGFRRATQRERG